MRSLTSLWGPPIAAAIDTANERCAVDVGGANGSLLHLLLEADPSLRGIVFGRSNVAEHAKAELVRKRLAERAGIAGGDLFKSVSEGDLYLLKFIMHDWNDEECVTVCVDAVRRWRRGRVAIIELVVESDNPIAALWDMPMLGVCTGRERSLDEFEVLLAAGGLRLSAVRQTSTPQLVIEAALDA